MNFEIRAIVCNQIWHGKGKDGQESFLYNVQVPNEKKKWSIFTKVNLAIQDDVTFKGYCSESKKKIKDANGKDIWGVSFNAEHVTINNQTDMPF